VRAIRLRSAFAEDLAKIARWFGDLCLKGNDSLRGGGDPPVEESFLVIKVIKTPDLAE